MLHISCSITKFIPEDKVLLVSNEVKLKPSPLTKKKVDRNRIRYVISNPNYGLGKGYLHFYFKHSGLGDTTWWDRLFINKLSERPQWFTEESALQNKDDLIKHLNSAGYYQGSVNYEVQKKNKKAKVTYTVSPGNPLRVNSVRYSCEEPKIQKILDSLKPTLLLQPGSPLDEQLLYPDQATIIQTLQDAGYFQISKSNFDYYYQDTSRQSIDLKCDILVPDGQSGFEQFRIQQIHVYSYDRLTNPDYKVDTLLDGITYHNNSPQVIRPNILRKYIKFAPGELYNQSNIFLTRNNLQNLGIYRSTSVLPERASDSTLNINLFLPTVKRPEINCLISGWHFNTVTVICLKEPNNLPSP
jgi:hypothetical protein